jgi:hypothetical protein
MKALKAVPQLLRIGQRSTGRAPLLRRSESAGRPALYTAPPTHNLHTSTQTSATRKKKAAVDSDSTDADKKSKPAADVAPEKMTAIKKKLLEYLEDEWTEAEVDTLEVVASQAREAIFFDLPKATRSKKSEDFDDSIGTAVEAIDEDGNVTTPSKSTYIGGLPLVPSDSTGSWNWPTQKIKLSSGREVSVPLEFVFQIDLAELPRSKLSSNDQAALPDVGLLQFFASNINWIKESNLDKFDSDWSEGVPKSGWITSVRHVPVGGSPQQPSKDSEIQPRIHARMELAPRLGLSIRPRLLMAENLTVEEGGPTPFNFDGVVDLVESKHERTAHQLLGMPQAFEGHIEMDAARTVQLSGEPEPKEALKWRCLLQITADSETGVFASDDPDVRVWFMIRADDLVSRKWDKIVAIHQK